MNPVQNKIKPENPENSAEDKKHTAEYQSSAHAETKPLNPDVPSPFQPTKFYFVYHNKR